MLTAKQLLEMREKAESDFLSCFRGSYNRIDAWIREYDKWCRNEEGRVDYIGFYKLLDCTFVTPSEAGHVEYNTLGKIKAVQIKTLMIEGKPMAQCQEGVYEGLDFQGEGDTYDIPFARCFPIFVEMLEAYDNLAITHSA